MSVLEKIRAEIEEQKQVHENESNVDYGVRSGLSIALNILDKYADQEEDILDALHIAQAHEKMLAKQGDKMLQKLKELECEDVVSRQHIIEQYKSCADMLSDEELEGADLVMEWVYKAPSVRPQEPCEDAVSRQAVLYGVNDMFVQDWVRVLFETMVKELPSVQPKRGAE